MDVSARGSVMWEEAGSTRREPTIVITYHIQPLSITGIKLGYIIALSNTLLGHLIKVV